MASEAELERMVVRLIGDNKGLIKVLRDTEKEVKRAASSISRNLQGIGRSMATAGRSMSLRFTAPIVAGLVGVFKVTADFQAEMSKIVGLVGVSKKQVGEWSKELLTLGPALGKTPTEMAKGLFFVTSAGFRGQEALDVLTMSAKASAGGLGEVESIADAVTSAVNAYGIENLSAAKATDILTATVREGKLEASSITPIMGQLIPTASNLGIAFEDVAGALAAMSRTGTPAAEGATSLSAIMSTMLKPTSEAVKMLGKAGLSFKQLRDIASGPGGLIKVMRLLDTTFKGDKEALAAVVPNVRAFRAIMNVLGQEAKTVDSVMNGVTNSTGATEKAFQEASQTAKFQFNKAMATLKASAIEFGTDIMPTLTTVINKVSDAFVIAKNVWSSLTPEIKQTIIVAGLLVAGLGPVLVIFGTLVSSIGTIVGLLGALLSPVTLIIAGVATLVALLVDMTIGWENALDMVKTFFMNALGFVMNFQENLGIMKTWFSKNWRNMLDDALTILIKFGLLVVEGIMLSVRSLWTIFKNLFTVDFLKFITTGLIFAAKAFHKFAVWAWKKLKSIFTGKGGPTFSDFVGQLQKDAQGIDFKFVDNVTKGLKEDLSKFDNPFKDFDAKTAAPPKFNTELPDVLFGGVKERTKKEVKNIKKTLAQVPKVVPVKFQSSGVDAIEAGSLAARIRINEHRSKIAAQRMETNPNKKSQSPAANNDAAKGLQVAKETRDGINTLVKITKDGARNSKIQPAGLN